MTRNPAVPDPLAARRAAATLVRSVVEGGRLLRDAGAPLIPLSAEDRARAQRLALDTLRRIGPLDALAARHLRHPPPAAVRAVLRVALAELVQRPTEAHGIVNAAVTLAREAGGKGAGGLVNAILRRLAADPAPGALAVQRLPDWIRTPVVGAWGEEAAAAMEAAHLAGPALDLTLRDPGAAADWAARLGGRVLATGGIRLDPGRQVTALEGYDAGAWWVQDAAASVPAQILAPRPGERVADLCAAPGGKTLQMAAAGAQVTAVDIAPGRMERVAENLARCRLEAELVVADLRDWQPAEAFDAVLLDAPCSATGTIRRHPDLPFARRAGDLHELIALQAELFDRAVAMVRPGGRIVYATCSIIPAEGEGQLAAALRRHPQLAPAPLPEWTAAWQADPGALRIRPDHWADGGGIDGFFVASLRRG
ncbi:MAG: RsmB/NOP family class I SAM-dependent RNA methyltransferase [Gemmobacter sp.]